MAAVRPEYGPSLAALAGPRWRALPPRTRLAIAALAALVVVALLAFAVRGSTDDRRPIVVRGPIAFNLLAGPGLERVAAHPGELLRLESDGSRRDRQTYVVRPLRLPAYRGDLSAGFLAATATTTQEMGRADPAFVYRGEGRARVNDLPGYQLLYVTSRDGRTVYGRRVLLVPDEPGARSGVVITLEADRSPAVPNVDAVGNNGLLKTPLRSFRFGTERP
jgi:hypothetical protein